MALESPLNKEGTQKQKVGSIKKGVEVTPLFFWF